MRYYLSPPPQNPLARILTAIAALLVLAGAFMLGIVALVVVAGLGLLVWLGVWMRMLWLRRHLRNRSAGDGDRRHGDSGEDRVIETEYTIISRRRDP
jgi:uncharacterized membrane protein YraQ (UPF0718 family)